MDAKAREMNIRRFFRRARLKVIPLLILTWSVWGLSFFLDDIGAQIILGLISIAFTFGTFKVYRLSRHTENRIRAKLNELLPAMSNQPSGKRLKQASFGIRFRAKVAVFLILVTFSMIIFLIFHSARFHEDEAGFLFLIIPLGMVALRDATSFRVANGALERTPWLFFFYRQKVNIEDLRAFRLTRRTHRSQALIEENLEWLEFYDANFTPRFRICYGQMEVEALKLWAENELANLDILNDLRNPTVLKRLKSKRL
jgi:hypothetical protein